MLNLGESIELNENQMKGFFLLFFGIYLFHDFRFQNENIILKNKKPRQKEELKRFLIILGQMVGEEFYFIQNLDGSTLELCCHSDPNFFLKMLKELSITVLDEKSNRRKIL